MFMKFLLICAISTGALGTSVAAGITPTGIEFAAGPIRVEAGNGNLFTAHMAGHTPLTLTINLHDQHQVLIKF